MGAVQGYLRELGESGIIAPASKVIVPASYSSGVQAATPRKVQEYAGGPTTRRQFLKGLAALGAALCVSGASIPAYADSHEQQEQPKVEVAKQMPKLPHGYREATKDDTDRLRAHLADREKMRYVLHAVRENWFAPETRVFAHSSGREWIPYEGGDTLPRKRRIELVGKGDLEFLFNVDTKRMEKDFRGKDAAIVYLEVERASKIKPEGIRRKVVVGRFLDPIPFDRKRIQYALNVWYEGRPGLFVGIYDPEGSVDFVNPTNAARNPDYTEELKEWITGEVHRISRAFIRGGYFSDERIKAGAFNEQTP